VNEHIEELFVTFSLKKIYFIPNSWFEENFGWERVNCTNHNCTKTGISSLFENKHGHFGKQNFRKDKNLEKKKIGKEKTIEKKH
jgi:hypothetical protein